MATFNTKKDLHVTDNAIQTVHRSLQDVIYIDLLRRHFIGNILMCLYSAIVTYMEDGINLLINLYLKTLCNGTQLNVSSWACGGQALKMRME